MLTSSLKLLIVLLLLVLVALGSSMLELDDFKQVMKLTSLYRALDYYAEKYEETKKAIQALAVNMSPSDIRYAIKESEK